MALCVAALALAGLAGRRLSLPRPQDAEPFHQHVREVSARLNADIGNWKAHDIPPTTETVEALKPNVFINRQYVNSATGQRMGLMFIQCRDVRDLAPHYPPVCYPGSGLTLAKQEKVQLRAGDLSMQATRYTFESNDFRRVGETVVDDLIILPDGRIQGDMSGVERRIGSWQRYFGAAQVQLVSTDVDSQAAQTHNSELILTALRPLIDAARSQPAPGAEK